MSSLDRLSPSSLKVLRGGKSIHSNFPMKKPRILPSLTSIKDKLCPNEKGGRYSSNASIEKRKGSKGQSAVSDLKYSVVDLQY